MNFPLFRYSVKRSCLLWLVCTALMCLYAFSVVRMYDPDAGKAMMHFVQSQPHAMELLGMTQFDNTFTAFIVNYLYGMLLLALPMLFTILLSVQLIAHYVSNGTMSYLLASPNSRKCIVSTQRNVLIASLLTMFAAVCLATIILCEYYYPGQLAVKHFLLLTACVLALQLTFAGLCFLVSCRCNSVGKALLLNAALCILFYMLRLAANIGGSLSYLRYITPYTLLNPTGILQTNMQACLQPLALLVLAVVLFALASRSFSKKTMPF